MHTPVIDLRYHEKAGLGIHKFAASHGLVCVGRDGHSHRIWRYQSEANLSDHLQTRPNVIDPDRAKCFAPACRGESL